MAILFQVQTWGEIGSQLRSLSI